MNVTQPEVFVDRRSHRAGRPDEFAERRQFAESRDGLNPDVRELAEAIDAFKLAHNRRYVTLTEVMQVVKGLGYHK